MTWSITGLWLAETGPENVWKPCGMVVLADDESEAWGKFWDEYHKSSLSIRPWRELKIERGK